MENILFTSNRAVWTRRDLYETAARNSCLLRQQIGGSRSTVLLKQECILCKVMSYQVFTEAKSRSLIWTVMGVFTLLRGQCSGTAHHRSTSKACQKYWWVWTWAGKFTVAIIHHVRHMKEGQPDVENRLLFTLPYLFFILLQNFTQPIANLHTQVEHRGTEQQKIKSISRSKGINNIKDKLFL